MSSITASTRQDIRILTLVSTGHFCSHFYMLALPSMFIFMNADLGISFTALGAMLSLRYISTGMAQVPAGFLVDRYGAKIMLSTGMFILVAAFAAMAFAPNYWVLVALVVIGGIGDSVFHPADYAILNGSVSEGRMARAFSVHTFSGHLGFAAAPVVITFLSALWDWRVALLIVSAFGGATLIVLVTQWNSLKDDRIAPNPGSRRKKTSGDESAFTENRKMLLSRPVLILFTFFAMSTLAGTGLHSFSIPTLNALHGTSATDAGAAVGAYMLVSSFAVLIGGIIADRIRRQDHFAALIYALSIVAVLLITFFSVHYALLVLFFAFAGFCHGVVRPARDMMVRAVTPEGASGRVFGFIFTGQNVGGAIAPVLLGFVLDRFPPEYVFYTAIFFIALCVVAVLLPGGAMSPTASRAASQAAKGDGQNQA